MKTYSIPLTEINNIIISPNGTKYCLDSLLLAINEFNKECPKYGWALNRKMIECRGNYTHITYDIKYVHNSLMANIELLNQQYENAKIKPIIIIPLHFGSGIIIKKVIKIINICLED